MFDFIWHYALPVGVFAYCYVRIFHIIRRQSKVLAGHVDVAMATMPRDQNTGHVSGAAAGTKLSRTELNIIQTMISVIVKK